MLLRYLQGCNLFLKVVGTQGQDQVGNQVIQPNCQKNMLVFYVSRNLENQRFKNMLNINISKIC